jgi:uncharacterized protein (TIGR00661 family)
VKILYAAQNNSNARIQLSRFLRAMQGSPHQIKIAAFKISSPKNVSIDWTLNSLLNMYQPEIMGLDNDNLHIYFEQVKYYAPDLIISDLEYFTSYIANVLNIAIWQCSSSLVNFAFERNERYNSGAHKYYAHAIARNERHAQRTNNLLVNSDSNLIYSHFGDTAEPPKLQGRFEWIRPYHRIGKTAIPCQHHIVAGISHNNKQVLGMLKKYTDSVAFTDFSGETYQNVLIKDIDNEEEYFCNLKNSPLFVCQGQTSFLADAFYNGKYSLIYPDYQDAETILNSQVAQYLKLGRIVNPTEDLDSYLGHTTVPEYNENIKYLHQHIENL